jgi:hypothetical protein
MYSLTASETRLIVTNPNGLVWQFTPTGKGLYAYYGTSEDQSWAWAHINTVEERIQECTKCEYCDVRLAWKIQNIIMFPGVCQFAIIADSKLTLTTLAVGECIFGPILEALKGKTVNCPSVPVARCIERVPPSILNGTSRLLC